MSSQWTQHLNADGVAMDAQIDQKDAENVLVQQQLAAALDELAKYQQPPPPPPDPTTQMWVGSSLYVPGGYTLQQGYDQRCTAWGVPDLEGVRYFFPGMPNGWPTFGGAPTLASFKPPNNDVKGFGAGKYTVATDAWLNSLPRDTRVRPVAIYHEREDNIERGEFNFADAKAMDKQFHDRVVAANLRNGTRLTFGLILMGWTVDVASRRDVKNYLPTDYTYDWIGWDAYTGDKLSLDLPNLSYTTSLFTACRDATKAHGAKNWFICETGTANYGHSDNEYDAMQADWLTGAMEIARGLGCRRVFYWDSVDAVQDNGSVLPSDDYRIKGPKARAAMGAQIKK